VAAKTYSEYIKWCKKTKRWPVAGKHVWVAATKAAEEKFTSANSQSVAMALKTLRNRFEEVYRTECQGGAAYLFQEIIREFNEFISTPQHT